MCGTYFDHWCEEDSTVCSLHCHKMECIWKGFKEAKQLTRGSDKQSGSAKLFHCAACNKEYQAVHERFNFC